MVTWQCVSILAKIYISHKKMFNYKLQTNTTMCVLELVTLILVWVVYMLNVYFVDAEIPLPKKPTKST